MKESARWKQWLDVQRPYRWNLQRLDLGFTLDVGCGLGRSLGHLGGNGVGVDHNATSVELCRKRGFEAYTPTGFRASARARLKTFDTLLLSHVVEHLSVDEATELVRSHVAFVRPGGKLVLIAPQRRGFRSDRTHVTYMDFDALAMVAGAVGAQIQRRFSFPFPWVWTGDLFTYNEFVVVATLPD